MGIQEPIQTLMPDAEALSLQGAATQWRSTRQCAQGVPPTTAPPDSHPGGSRPHTGRGLTTTEGTNGFLITGRAPLQFLLQGEGQQVGTHCPQLHCYFSHTITAVGQVAEACNSPCPSTRLRVLSSLLSNGRGPMREGTRLVQPLPQSNLNCTLQGQQSIYVPQNKRTGLRTIQTPQESVREPNV